MTDMASAYDRIADTNIATLKSKCLRGLYSERMFRTVAKGLDKFYPLEKLDWMSGFLRNGNQHIAAGCLECMCAHGYSLEDATDILLERIDDRIFSSKVIELAERYDKPDVLIHFMDEGKGYVNRVIIALKNIHHEDYLTTLMLSDNESLVKSVDRITRGK